MEGYGQFCPIALGAEIFAQRWTPLILRELLLGSHRFSELQRGVPRISRNLLVQRLGALEKAGIIERRPRVDRRGYDYYPTPAGEELRPVVHALGAWGYRWAARKLRPENLDARLLMWFLRRSIKVDRLPAHRVVTRFDFHAPDLSPGRSKHPESFWLVLDRPEVELCLSDPGHEVDLTVRADVSALTRVYLGHLSLLTTLRDGSVELIGRRALRAGFHAWLGISGFAPGRRQPAHPATLS
ncbi:MAG TPA: helix-turn-helix domain-containing protein [Candidatus Limnocylindria bacterium]